MEIGVGLKGLWRWRPISERGVRPDRTAVLAPLVGYNLGFLQAAKDFSVEQLIG
jgi:hypothetical protein